MEDRVYRVEWVNWIEANSPENALQLACEILMDERHEEAPYFFVGETASDGITGVNMVEYDARTTYPRTPDSD